MRNSASSSIAGLVIALFVSIAFQGSTPAYAEKKGPGSTGGGNAVMTASGQLRFIDSLTAEEIEAIKTNAWTALDTIQKSIPYQFGYRSNTVKYPDFFTCAKAEIEATNLITEEQKILWLNALSTITVTRSSVPNIALFKYEGTTIAGAVFQARGEIPVLPFAYSSKTSIFNQIPIAAYRDLTIDIYDDFYAQLTDEDQCDTQVHESIRVFGDTIGSTLFTTNEVEALTQGIRGHKIVDEVSYKSALNKLVSKH